MKKYLAIMLVVVIAVMGFAGCKKQKPQPAENQPKVMTHAEYEAAALETEVTVETYVQAKQSWWEDKATVYCQSPDGAYFAYNMTCSEEDYAKL